MRELSEQEIVRRNKLDEIRKVCNPYPERFEKTHALKEAKVLEDGVDNVSVAGRIIFMRKMGKLCSYKRFRSRYATWNKNRHGWRRKLWLL